MISYSRQQKALKELAELETITKQKKLEQEKQEAIELFREQTKDIHTTEEQSIEEINQWCGNKTFIEKLYDFVDSHFVLMSIVFAIILDIVFMFYAIHAGGAMNVICTILFFILFAFIFFVLIIMGFLKFTDLLESNIPNLIDKIKEKTLDVNYSISENTIDCPIEIKKELLYELKSGYVYIKIDLESRHQRRQFSFITEDGEVNTYNTDFDNVYNDEIWYDLYYSKELCYFANQLKDGTMYKISDILTDRAVK